MVLSYFLECFIYAILGILFGLTVDHLSLTLQKKYQLSPELMLFLQLIWLIGIIAFLELFVSKEFAAAWQDGTEGIFFVGMFFGMQFNFYQNITTTKNNFINLISKQ